MADPKNFCKLRVYYECTCYNQPTCKHFENFGGVSTYCLYGLPDRKCQNHEAVMEALNDYLCSINYEGEVNGIQKTLDS